MKKEFEYYLSVFSFFLKNRSRSGEKKAFLEKAANLFGNTGHEIRLDEIEGSTVMEIGDVAKSRYIVMAAYDVPGRTVLPQFRYYPADLDKSKKYEVLNIALQILINLLTAGIGVMVLSRLSQAKLIYRILAALGWMIVLYLVYVLTMGPVKDNVTRNNCLSLAYMLADSDLPKVAYVLADRSSVNSLGMRKYIEKNADVLADKKVFVLDSLGEGETFIIGDGQLKTELKQVKFDGRTHSILSYLKNGYVIANGYQDGEAVYVRNHRNDKCQPVNVDILKKTCGKIRKLLEK